MKAIDYYNLYSEKMLSSDEEIAKEATCSVFSDFSKEAVEICNARNSKLNESLISAMREQNQKWNALCNLFIKKHGVSPLAENGFREFWNNKMPELKV